MLHNKSVLKPVRYILLLFVALISPSGLASAFGQTTQHEHSDLLQLGASPVSIEVVVNDEKGGYLRGLSKEYFSLFDNGQPRTITDFSSVDDPVTVCILIDTSGSVDASHRRALPENLRDLKDAIARLIQASNDDNSYFVFTFSDKPQILVDNASRTEALAGLEKLESLQIKGSTALLDSCSLAIEKAMSSSHTRRAIIMMGDGADTSSSIDERKIERLIRENGIMFYAINTAPSYEYLLSPIPPIAVGEWAKASTGLTFRIKKPGNLSESLSMIAQDLRNRYRLGFTPSDGAKDGEWHRIEVKLNIKPDKVPGLKHIKVRNQLGYYAAVGK